MIDTRFDLLNEETMKVLLQDNPNLLPTYGVNTAKDILWNEQHLTSVLQEGVLQGSGIQEITRNLLGGVSNVTSSNRASATRTIRTAMNSAQNQGRIDSYSRAKALGLKGKLRWVATIDMRTRDTHALLDGEEIEMGDTFSNGLEYPGDPSGDASEVYNCRCTTIFVPEEVDYSDAQRDMYTWDGFSRIEDMTYDEWKQYHLDRLEAQVLPNFPEFAKLLGDEGQTILEERAAQAEIAKATNEVDQAQAAYDTAKAKYDQSTAKLEAAKKAAGGDEVFTGIWKNPVKVSEYEDKAASITAKAKYYDEKIAAGIDVAKHEKMLDMLWEYEAKGLNYEASKSKITSAKRQNTIARRKAEKARLELQEAKRKLNSLLGIEEKSTPFAAEAYTQERKDAAMWAKSAKEADGRLRSKAGELWRGATEAEKDAMYEYTVSYSKFNEPLRGWEYGVANYHTGYGFKGVGNVALNKSGQGKMLNDMTNYIERSTYDFDIWVQRGTGAGSIENMFGIKNGSLMSMSQDELEKELLGKSGTEFGFCSTGDAKGAGFTSKDVILNIYCPNGTKMAYMEPFSAYNQDTVNRTWDGISQAKRFGSEAEVLLQQGTELRVTKVEKEGRYGRIYIDVDVVAQDAEKLQYWSGSLV